MKYKNYFKSIIYLALGAFTLGSCEDFLDRQEDEKLTFDKIWKSRNTTQQYWLNAMSFLPNENGSLHGTPHRFLIIRWTTIIKVSANVIFSCKMCTNAATR